MKHLKFMAAALAAFGMVACCNNCPQQYTGFIADASMNTVTVKALTGDATQTFSTEQADMAQANGLLIGSPVVVDYNGKLAEVTPATKITADPTYAEAVGSWTMPDPLNPDSLKMGVQIMVEGAAQSINMATLRYASWELQGEADKILLKGVSEGSGAPIDFTETGMIAKDSLGNFTLSIEGTGVVYTKTF